jgi:hypothetical protein
MRDDSRVFHQTFDLSMGSGWNNVLVEWRAAVDGGGSLRLNDGTPETLSGLDTSDRRIDFVRWGSVGGVFSSSSGSIYLDVFSSWR